MRHYRVLFGLLLLVSLLFLSGCEEVLCLLGLCPGPVAAHIYAFEVRGFSICTANNNYCDPSKAIGPPDETNPWTGHFVSLGGEGGYIIATMERGFTNGPGADLRIYEVGRLQGGEDEPFDVFISRDGITWIQVADDIQNDLNERYASIDISPNIGNYLYIKVIDESTQRSTLRGTPGSDIDALEALYEAATVPYKFKPGDVVKVVGTGDLGLNVRDAPAGEVIKTGPPDKGDRHPPVPDGWTFRIIGGPETAVLKGKSYNWWKVREEGYEPSPIEGWVAEDFLELVSAAGLVPNTPPDYFIAAHEQVEKAIDWAKSQEGKRDWENLCLGFVAEAFGVTKIGWGCPQEGVGSCPMGGVEKLKKEGKFYPAEDSWNPPRGALIFFSGKGKDPKSGLDYEKCGHIGIYLGGGRVVHAYGEVGINSIAGSKGIERLSHIGSYIGWAYPPREWLSGKTGQIRRLTSNTANDLAPTWSPDGQTIVFLSNRVNPQDGYDLFAVNPDGSGERGIARFTVTGPWGGGFGDPSWLDMTGDLLVIDSKYYWEIMLFRLSQATTLPVTRDVEDGDSPYFTRLLFVPGGQAAFSPVTSRDGLKLAWAALIDNWAYVPAEERRYEVRVYEGPLDSFIGDTDKAGQVVFRTEPGGFIEGVGSVAFSPDGMKLAIAAAVRGWATGTGRDIYVVDLETGESRRLTRTGEQGMDNANLTWSSKGLIAFSSGPRGGPHDLYLIRPDGTGLTQLTDTPWDEITPSWSPDGTHLAFASDEGGNYDIYVKEVQ